MPSTDHFKRGTAELAVLSILKEKEMYGYEIVKAITEKSKGYFSLPLGTLYPILYRFVENGLVSDRDDIVNKRLRKYYRLEEKGMQYCKEMQVEFEKISKGVNNILGTVTDDE